RQGARADPFAKDGSLLFRNAGTVGRRHRSVFDETDQLRGVRGVWHNSSALQQLPVVQDVEPRLRLLRILAMTGKAVFTQDLLGLCAEVFRPRRSRGSTEQQTDDAEPGGVHRGNPPLAERGVLAP